MAVADPQNPQTPALQPGADVTSLMPGADVTGLMGGGAPPPNLNSPNSPLAHGVMEFFSNFNPVAMAKAFTPDNPVEAAFGPAGALAGHLIDAAKQRLTQARTAAANGDPAQAALHVAGAIPVIGPVIDKIGTGIKNRDENLLAEGLGDAAALGSGALFDPGAAIGKVADVASDIAETGSTAAMTRAIAPMSGAQKARFGNMAVDVAPRLATEPGMGASSTTALAGKIGERLQTATDALDTAADARNANKPIVTQPILDALQAARDRLTAAPVQGSRIIPEVTGPPVSIGVSQPQPRSPSGAFMVPSSATDVPLGPVAPRVQPGLTMGSPRDLQTGAFTGSPDVAPRAIGQPVVPGPNAARVAVLDRAMDEIRQLGPVANYDALKTIRQAYDGPAKMVYSPVSGQDFSTVMGTKYASSDVASAVRDTLGDADPITAKANAEYSFWKRANDVIQAQQEAARVAPNRLKTAVVSGIGSTLGYHMGGLPDAVAGAFLGPALDAANAMGYTTKITVSRQLANLSKALSTGDGAGAMSSLRTIGALTRTLPALNQSLAGGGS